jgi:hypothetical protein
VTFPRSCRVVGKNDKTGDAVGVCECRAAVKEAKGTEWNIWSDLLGDLSMRAK